MSVLKVVNHKKMSNIEIKFGQIMQCAGVNSDVKNYMGQILTWYLTKHKYTDSELEPFDYAEPIIEIDGEKLSRDYFECIKIQSSLDLHAHLSMSKGTLMHQYFQSVFNTIDVEREIAEVNDIVERLALHLDSSEEIKYLDVDENIKFGIESTPILLTDILLKYLTVNANISGVKTPVEYLNSRDKFIVLLKLLKNRLKEKTKPVLLVLRNFDDLISYQDYLRLISALKELATDFPHFHCILIPSQIGYVYVDEELIDQITIFGDLIIGMESLDLMINSIDRHYPDSRIPPKEDIIKNLTIILPYLFTKEYHGVHFSVKQLVLMKLINTLFGYYETPTARIEDFSELERRFII